MPRPALILTALLALSACRFDTYYAEGASIAARDRDQAQCQAEARRDLPVQLITRVTPRQFHPGIRQCDAAGTCTVSAPYWTGGQPYSVDLNEEARAGAETACMAARGYTLISLPACPQGTAVAASTTMAALSPETCLINRQNGALVVTP